MCVSVAALKPDITKGILHDTEIPSISYPQENLTPGAVETVTLGNNMKSKVSSSYTVFNMVPGHMDTYFYFSIL